MPEHAARTQRPMGYGEERGVPPELARTWLMRSGRPETPDAWGATTADALVVDLEDAVPDGEKPEARKRLAVALRGGWRAWARISAHGTPQWREDVEALRGATGLRGIVLAKTEHAGAVRETVAAFAGVPIVPLIESARGLQEVESIAQAARVVRLGFGADDFCRDTGLPGTDASLAPVRSRIAIASAAAKISGPIDGGARGTDACELGAQAGAAAELGFTGKFCLLESQISPVSEVFGIAAERIPRTR